MKKFLLHMYVSFCLYRLGYNWSKLTHESEKWGFYRLNFELGERKDYAIVDVDFARDDGGLHDYSHVHGFYDPIGNVTLHRYDS